VNEQSQISSKQLGIYILGAQIGLGIIFNPPQIAQSTGHDGWISFILGGIVSTGIIILVMLFLRRYRDKSVYQINRLLFGKAAGTVINIFLVFYLFYLTFMALRHFAECILITQAGHISLLAVSILITMPTIYLTTKGLPVICNFTYSILFFLSLSILLIGFVAPFHWSFLLPVGASGLAPIIRVLPTCTIGFIGFELVAFLYPLVKDKQRALFWVVTANLTTMLYYVFVFILNTGLLGEQMLKKTLIPFFQLPQFIRFGLMERMDLLFSLFWFPFLESTFRSYFYASYAGIVNLVGIKRTNASLLVFSIGVVLFNLVPENFNQTLKFAELITYSGAGVIGILLVSYGISFFKESLKKA
jgi:spore germination protein BB